jgi:phage portal protein BeeE
VGLLDRIAATQGRVEKRYTTDQWLSEYLFPSQFTYGNTNYPLGLNQTYSANRVQEVSNSLPGYSHAVKGCPPAFAAEMVRALVLSQARFVFRNKPWATRPNTKFTPGRKFGTTALGLLERPWPGATTGDLLSRMEWHAGLAGISYVVRRSDARGDRLRVLRPDWCALVYGSELEPEDPSHAIDGELLGLVYQNGGLHASNTARIHTFTPDEFISWAPLPDPECAGMGMSWITPAVREIQGDAAATMHKLQFFSNGATPNMVVKGITAASKEQFDDIVAMMEDNHAGVANAYKTLYLAAGADATVVGSDMKQLDFKLTQGTGETRIAFLSRVPAPLLGISEGLAGSSLNAGNFGMARRIFADTWVYPTLQDLASSVAPLVKVPADADLWFDASDIPLLKEDEKDAAEIASTKAIAIRTLWDGGADPDTAIATIAPDWVSSLKHSGKLSVQLQEPGASPTPYPTQKPIGGNSGD